MRKPLLRPAAWVAVLVLRVLVACSSPVAAAEQRASLPAADALSQGLLDRAQFEVNKIKALVEQGTLPRARLVEAEEQLADAQDEVTLARTLYGQNHLQDITSQEAIAMTEAAKRRLERQRKIVNERKELVDSGILARSDFEALEQELAARQRVVELVSNRVKLLDELKQMAEAEKRLEASNGAPSLSSVMIRYDGNRLFQLSDLKIISGQFERKFRHALPVSAFGQTALHQSMGLDHRNRVDVPLNPNSPEGLWLRALLERLHIPYLAFRSAFAGAATAPHIHIGPGSSRLTPANS